MHTRPASKNGGGRSDMTAVNIVRFRVKPGQEEAFVRAHEVATLRADGLHGARLIKTGDRTYCFVGQWESMAALAGARPAMIAILDSFRHTLEDQGGGIGLTDAVSGEVVVELA